MSNKIENLMDQSSWSAGDLEDRDVVDQHMRSNNEGDYIEVDMQSSPEVVRQVASQQKDAARKKKKRLALIGVAVISVAATILAVGMAQRQQPPAAVAVPVQADLAGAGKPAQEVASQFAAAPSAQPPQGAQPSEAAAQAQAGPAQQQPAAASAPANEAGSSSAPSPAGSVATVALPQQASTQASA
ncbi:MAG: hypothetical protein N2690_07785, partial [Rhodocyclaceae bacterium]|nr:hypothetical protein [Rhodocyclaceae bacterium]